MAVLRTILSIPFICGFHVIAFRFGAPTSAEPPESTSVNPACEKKLQMLEAELPGGTFGQVADMFELALISLMMDLLKHLTHDVRGRLNCNNRGCCGFARRRRRA